MEQVREIDGEQAYEKMRRAVEKAWIFREAKDWVTVFRERWIISDPLPIPKRTRDASSSG